MNSMSSAYDETSGIFLTGRLWIVWEISLGVNKGQRQNIFLCVFFCFFFSLSLVLFCIIFRVRFT